MTGFLRKITSEMVVFLGGERDTYELDLSNSFIGGKEIWKEMQWRNIITLTMAQESPAYFKATVFSTFILLMRNELQSVVVFYQTLFVTGRGFQNKTNISKSISKWGDFS